jgi:hypothetical protein
MRDFYLAESAALLALISFIVDCGSQTTSWLGNALAIISVAVNRGNNFRSSEQ